jgi:hypothetical protein
MKALPYFTYVVTAVLLVLAGVFSSAAFAYAAVLSLVITVGQSGYERILANKEVKNDLPEEAKKRLQVLDQRITAIEAGIARRGF